MLVSQVIVEELYLDGKLKTLIIRRDAEPLTIAFADEYDDARWGPFHFLEEEHRLRFWNKFKKNRPRQVNAKNFGLKQDEYFFNSCWRGIPNGQNDYAFYALSLPKNSVPTWIVFKDPQSHRSFKKRIVRDDQNRKFILYLECKSWLRPPPQSFDFELNVRFKISEEDFSQQSYNDSFTTEETPTIDINDLQATHFADGSVQIFNSEVHMTISKDTKYDVKVEGGQVGAIGSKAKVQNSEFNQDLFQAARTFDLGKLACELDLLRAAMRREAVSPEQDQAIANVAAAETAAKKQDGIAALQSLKEAGKWALDIATKIGVEVAAKAIQRSLGM